ncbi:MAG TPA: M42 family metallopeptidase [Desulfuromonadales bacterium]|jgi:endoglucanase|nr:M42 family metallopeptidase [Desulfuromonadales bacterium]MDH3869243.1 M42 family metallopeptidase [Desulfuromonadales bacterium]HKJ29677.1 M42 family metallopeptidase [Desulfuromonadales bacterium]
MNENDFKFFKELIEAPSPSGFEQPAQRVIREALADVADDVRTDVMGNVVAHVKGPKGAPRLMLAGHCDEIGFMVKYVDDQGYLFFAPIGGVDAHLVPGQRVTVHTSGGPIAGVVGKRPIHQIEVKDRETVVPFKSQFIDVGCSSKDEAVELVSIGDPVTFRVGVERLQGTRLTSRAFDDKMGAFIVAQVLREVRRQNRMTVDLHGVSTVQEEVGLRGGATSAYGVQPDIGIAVEVGFASDYPGADHKDLGEVSLGKGPVIARGPNINPVLFDLLKKTAEEENIPCQIMGIPRATGTDANVMQLVHGGVATALISIPLRYMHTPVEVLDWVDLEGAVKLLSALCSRIAKDHSFVPN